MSNNIILPFEIINKILLMRQPHPIVKILRNYAKIYLCEYEIDNIFYCKNPIYWMQYSLYWMEHNEFCEMYCFNYKYKSYIRKKRLMYNWCINEIEREIFIYNKFINSINDSEKMETFITFIISSRDIDI